MPIVSFLFVAIFLRAVARDLMFGYCTKLFLELSSVDGVTARDGNILILGIPFDPSVPCPMPNSACWLGPRCRFEWDFHKKNWDRVHLYRSPRSRSSGMHFD